MNTGPVDAVGAAKMMQSAFSNASEALCATAVAIPDAFEGLQGVTRSRVFFRRLSRYGDRGSRSWDALAVFVRVAAVAGNTQDGD